MAIWRLSHSTVFATAMVSASLVSGCGKSTVDVNVHAVNYSGNEFSYLVRNPANPDESGAGEHIDPFATGGTTCCFTLPKRWHPGIKAQIRTVHWLPQAIDGSLPEVKESHIVDVPPYTDDKPGELWVLRAADGSVSVISSDFQPDHPRWPGKIKGWPVPSIEYQRERWELLRKHEENGVNLYLNFLASLEKSPRTEAKEAWEYAMKRDPSSLKQFSGPDDPNYMISLREHYMAGLKESRRRLKNVMEMRP